MKVKDFIDEKSTVYLGLLSHQYLKTELLTIDPTLLLKKIDSKKLVSQIKSDLFIFLVLITLTHRNMFLNNPQILKKGKAIKHELKSLKLHPDFS